MWFFPSLYGSVRWHSGCGVWLQNAFTSWAISRAPGMGMETKLRVRAACHLGTWWLRQKDRQKGELHEILSQNQRILDQ